MPNALLIGISRQLTLERQMDVVANNVANINTQASRATARCSGISDAGRARRQLRRRRPPPLLRQDRATFHDFASDPSEQTKNPLDVAIAGTGFLVVQTPAGERYTRDGSMQINNQGQLVTTSATRCSAPTARSCSTDRP
jgi:flagellar hook-basal body protein